MQQLIPDLNLVEYDGDFVCAQCQEEVGFLIGPEGGDPFFCKDCFSVQHPEYREALISFADLFIHLMEEKDRMMSQEDMHELYGNEDDTD